MRRRFRQALAGILAAVTIVTAMPADMVRAAEDSRDITDTDGRLPETGDAADDTNAPDADVTDDTNVPGGDTSDKVNAPAADVTDDTNVSGGDTADDTNVPDGGPQTADLLNDDTVQNDETDQSAETETKEALINYVAVDAGRLDPGDTQNIVIGIGEDGQVITAATLGYHRTDDGSTYETQAAAIIDNGIRFTMDYTSAEQNGEYVLDYLTYTMDGISYTVRFEETGMDVRYGVGVDVERDPDAEVVDEAVDTVDVDVISFDENGQQVSENSIAEAIENQQEDGISTARYGGSLVIVLDPGHDSAHAGASGNGLKEDELNLKIAQYCKEELEQYQGVTVYMTRTSAACPNGGYSVTSGECNEARVAFAQSVGANIYVSLHNNSNTSSSPHGVEVYRPNANYNQQIHDIGKGLAEDILEQLVALGLNNRGTVVRDCQDHTEEYMYPDGTQADYYAVIRNCKRAGIPAIIVEHAFVSNASDAANFLSSDEKLKKLGVADATGIANYYGLSKTGAYSAVFDAVYYADTYSDLKQLYGYNYSSLLSHFLNYGMSEGRRGNATFDVYSYRNAYSDLRSIYGNDLKQYYMHYVNYGQYENRVTSGVTTLRNPTTVYNGVDYSAVYDYNYYLNKYSDLRSLYSGDDVAAIRHFVTYGMSEGRQGKASFEVTSYYNAHRDLRSLYGKNWKQYYLHYVNYGAKEGRVATGVTSLRNGTTVYNGVDYSAVYDYNYYLNKYSDLKKLFSGDEDAAIRHFVTYGMSEGRQGKASFEVTSYYNAHRDLRALYGKDWKQYYLHYVNYGAKEGRVATGVTSLQNPTTVYNGVDYSAVYDYNYYLKTHPDVKAAYGGDEIATIRHFVNYGMQEGRMAKSTFNVSVYRANYLDLSTAYGNDLKAYYMHYVQYGAAEGRNAATRLYHSIMSGPTTTVNQMANYFNAKASYPSYYSTSDAPDIYSFCQIFYEESVAEGVDPAVAFCQTIVETGWLKFGGQVSIEQYNFAGLGALDSGEAGASFDSVRTGIRAQIQHLKAYASKDDLNNDLVDPRFQYVQRGCAPYVEWLGQQENPEGKGWATGKDYGSKIINHMGNLYTYAR